MHSAVKTFALYIIVITITLSGIRLFIRPPDIFMPDLSDHHILKPGVPRSVWKEIYSKNPIPGDPLPALCSCRQPQKERFLLLQLSGIIRNTEICSRLYRIRSDLIQLFDRLKEKCEKLQIMLDKYYTGKLDFIPNCSYDLLHEQYIYMMNYLSILMLQPILNLNFLGDLVNFGELQVVQTMI